MREVRPLRPDGPGPNLRILEIGDEILGGRSGEDRRGGGGAHYGRGPPEREPWLTERADRRGGRAGREVGPARRGELRREAIPALPKVLERGKHDEVVGGSGSRTDAVRPRRDGPSLVAGNVPHPRRHLGIAAITLELTGGLNSEDGYPRAPGKRGLGGQISLRRSAVASGQ